MLECKSTAATKELHFYFDFWGVKVLELGYYFALKIFQAHKDRAKVGGYR